MGAGLKEFSAADYTNATGEAGESGSADTCNHTSEHMSRLEGYAHNQQGLLSQ